jgi:hypothetical protein
MVEILVIFTLFEIERHAPYQRKRPMVQRNRFAEPLCRGDSGATLNAG